LNQEIKKENPQRRIWKPEIQELPTKESRNAGNSASFSWIPGLKLSRYPRFFAATLAALPSISEIPLLDS
jgi:hypothetical protein